MILTTIKAIADMFASLFGWRTTAIDNQTTSEVVGDKHDLERACRYAELAIELVEARAVFNRKLYASHFKRLVKKFREFKCR